MNPYNNPFSGSRREPEFARMFMASRNHYQPTHAQNSGTQPRASQSNRSNASPATGTSGTTTVIRPGEPHHYGTKLDREARANIINPLCRCRNPDSHRDAWADDGDGPWQADNRGMPISWKQTMNRVLDCYPGKTSVSWEEQYEAYQIILHPSSSRHMMDHYRSTNYHVRMGGRMMISPYQDTVQHYGGDGHARNNVTEDGLRTMIQRPDGGRRS
jgi:hypothetical protein